MASRALSVHRQKVSRAIKHVLRFALAPERRTRCGFIASGKVTETFLLLALTGLNLSHMETMRTEQNSPELVEAPSDKLLGDANSRMEMSSTPAQDVYEIRPRKDRNGFDLISDRLRRGPIWYAGPDAVRNAVAFAKYRSLSRSRWAIIRVFNEVGKVTEIHEQ
jgi:hypothetical protein